MANERRLIDIAPYENMVNATVCKIQVYRSGNGFCDVMNFKAENIPTVDAVEVVRCQDCRYAKFESKSSKYYCLHFPGCFRYANDFCSYGERKGGQAPQREDV